MDKKSEIALERRRSAPQPEESSSPAPTATATLEAPPPTPAAPLGDGWWMYHGGPQHGGYVSDSDITAANAAQLQTLYTIQLGGPVLSVPAVTDGFVYVGVANYHDTQDGTGNGGALHKIELASGTIVATFSWNLGQDNEDIHSFTGMGTTPAVTSDRVYFGAFNGKFYCLDKETLNLVWSTDLRNPDTKHNQPVSNINGVAAGYPPAVMWSSPVFNADGSRLYVGCGEGENPQMYSFVFCLDAASGDVVWIYCTNLFCTNDVNAPNVLPEQAVPVIPPPAPFSIFKGEPIVMGCSVWGSIAYDAESDRIYCPTGNQQPEPDGNWQPGQPVKPELPSPGFSNGLLSLDAATGQFHAFFQVPPDSNYRDSDFDIDVGSSPVIFDDAGQKAVAIPCKNGSLFILDPDTLTLRRTRQLLPKMNDGTQIPTVDPHPVDSNLDPHVSNDVSNATPGENYSGAFNTPAFYPGSDDNPQTISPRIFVALGGPNYHSPSPGIDYETTPFMRAVDAATLDDAWPLDGGDPPKYTKPFIHDDANGIYAGMYQTAGESGLSSPAVVNDVVVCTTSKISIYAFDVRDGTLLWHDDMGMQTDGYNGGYGYCLGAAVCKNYVVAGALVFGRDGGVLRIYGLPTPQASA
ncbi:MAG TPA: PQQ-binding-like beta-propeller repeat protein [Pyrinomonadaceae bacterium]